MVAVTPIAKADLFDGFEQFPVRDFEASSFQMDEFRLDDFSSMADELQALISDSEDVFMRHIPIVQRYGKDRGSLYVRDPERRFGLSNKREAEIHDWLVETQFNLFMGEASQMFACQNGLLIVPMMFGARMQLKAFLPGEVDVDQGPYLLDDDIRYARQVTCRVPIRRDSDGMVDFGAMVLTPDWAYIESKERGKKVQRGLYRDDGRNPLGYIPAVAVRNSINGRKGHFWNSIPQALQALQIGTSIGISDADFICRFQAYGRETLIGPNAEFAADNMVIGPNRLMVFEASGDLSGKTLEYNMINGDPKVDKYWLSMNFTIRLFEDYSYMRRGMIGADGSVAGDGANAVPFHEERGRIEKIWRNAEAQTLQLMRDLANTQNLIAIPKIKPTTVYHYVEPRINSLQDEQAFVLRAAFGKDGPIDRIMREENLSRPDALDRFVERLTDMANAMQRIRGVFGSNVPGVDAIASALGMANENPEAAKEKKKNLPPAQDAE